jgi:hypothetical protein
VNTWSLLQQGNEPNSVSSSIPDPWVFTAKGLLFLFIQPVMYPLKYSFDNNNSSIEKAFGFQLG